MSAIPVDRVVSFGPFQLHLDRRLLLEGGRPLRIGSRALEVLVALVERAGELVGKDELMARVWPNTTVEESNIKVHIAALRRALADGQEGNRYIQTVSGQGYRFVGMMSPAEVTIAEPASFAKPQQDLPEMVTRLAGRADVIGRLVRQLPQQQSETVVGRVGATSVVLVTVGALLSDCTHGAWLVDLGSFTDHRLVLSWLATALGLEVHAGELLPGLLAVIGQARMPLVLDNPEHVFRTMADLTIAAALRDAPQMDVPVTEREPLGAPVTHQNRAHLA